MVSLEFPGPARIDINRISPPRKIFLRFWYSVQLWSLKLAARIYTLVLRYIIGVGKGNAPTYVKSYPSTPTGNPAQIYIPKTYKSGDSPLPLLIDIHGGGFSVGAPLFDAPDNARWAHKHGFVVVSIGYRLAPTHAFPTAVHDVADQINEILSDKDLPVDFNRVAVVGYSAGGNLSLSAVQLHGIHNRIQASVAYYPAVDFVVTAEERDKWRTPHPDGRADVLSKSSYFFNWAYVPSGTSLRNPLLSPRFANPKQLPKSLFLLGCEYDMLCHDAWTMAEELAEKNGSGEKLEDARGEDSGWECGRIRWRLIRGVEHGFNFSLRHKKGSERALYQRKTESCQQDVVDWLHRVAFTQ